MNAHRHLRRNWRMARFAAVALAVLIAPLSLAQAAGHGGGRSGGVSSHAGGAGFGVVGGVRPGFKIGGHSGSFGGGGGWWYGYPSYYYYDGFYGTAIPAFDDSGFMPFSPYYSPFQPNPGLMNGSIVF